MWRRIGKVNARSRESTCQYWQVRLAGEEKPLTMVFGNGAFENVFNSLSLINNYKLGG
jgi:hypothetical protein